MIFSMIFGDVSFVVFITLHCVHRVAAKVFRVGRPKVAVRVHGGLVRTQRQPIAGSLKVLKTDLSLLVSMT